MDVSREITYANLIDRLYDLLGFDGSKYDLVLTVVYLGGGIIAPTLISNDEDLSFFLDEIFISIQHRTLLCISVVERIISVVPNPTQDSKIPSFMPKTVEAEKIPGHEVVQRQPASEAPINDDPELNSLFSFTMSRG